MKTKSIKLLLLPLLVGVYSCQTTSRKAGRQKIYSTLSPGITKDSSLFMFQFVLINFNTVKSIDSVRKATDTVTGLKGMKLSVRDKRCTFYCDSFKTYKVLISVIEKSGYEMEKTFDMMGPGLTCDIPPLDSNEDKKIDITKLDKSAIETIKTAFNKHKDKVRILTIPNPACLACVNGQRFINGLFKDSFSTDNDIIGLTIWTSISGWGKYKDASVLGCQNESR